MARTKTAKPKPEPTIRYIMKDGSILHTLDELEEYGKRITLPEYVVRLLYRIQVPED